MLRIAFMSSGAMHRSLEKLLANKKAVVGVVVPPETKDNRRFVKVREIAETAGIPVFITNSLKTAEFMAWLRQIKPDVVLSVGWKTVIPPEVIKFPKYCINAHPSLLPKYKGVHPLPWAIINGEKETGVTVHYVDEGVDTGDIILQKRFPIGPVDTVRQLFSRSLEIQADAVVEAITLLENGKAPRIQQDKSIKSYFPIRKPSDSQLDWDKPLKELFNTIRASDPFDYPAHFYVGGVKVNIAVWKEGDDIGSTKTN